MKTILALLCGTLIAFSLPCSSFADTAYTIKKGDNLYTIAKRHGVSVDRLKEANSLGTNRLMPGTKITIPSKGTPDKKQATAKKATATTPTAQETRGQGEAAPVPDVQYHTVQRGDTLQSVARKYSLPVSELKEMNSISRTKRLKAGQQLLVKKTGPRTYTVRKGDSLPKIAKRLGITEEDIKFLNDLETDDIRQGQKLLIEEWSEPENSGPFTTMISAATLGDDIRTMTESSELSSLGISDRVTLFAKKLLGIPYRFGGSSFMGIDCSAYVQKVFGFLNVPLPRSAREQFRVGEPVNKDELSIGDLVFFRTYASFPSHVGIYMGNNLFIHASSKGRKVTIDSLETPYYVKRFIGAKRLLNDESEEKKDTDKEG